MPQLVFLDRKTFHFVSNNKRIQLSIINKYDSQFWSKFHSIVLAAQSILEIAYLFRIYEIRDFTNALSRVYRITSEKEKERSMSLMMTTRRRETHTA